MTLKAIQNLLSYGAAIFLPLVIIIIGIGIRLKFTRAVSAGLILGVAFTGMNTVINMMGNAVGPAGQAMVEKTGLQLTALDIGTGVTTALAWAWPYAALMFALQIGVNILMLTLKMTDTLNVDMWNVQQKALLGGTIAYLTNSVPLAFVATSIWIILELKNADLMKNQVYKITQIPGVSITHCHMLDMAMMSPVDRLLTKIPFIRNSKSTPEAIREKIGFFGENHVLGFLVGVLLGWAAGYNLKQSLTLGMTAATSLVLFPMVAQLFMQSLTPISEAAGEFLRQRFPDREFTIGLDWPILAGHPSLWTAAIINIPFILLFAAILPGNKVLPFASLLMNGTTMAATLITGGDLIRTTLITVLWTPLNLWIATNFAPIVTNMAKVTGAFTLPEGAELVTSLKINGAIHRWAFQEISRIFNGAWMPGIVILPALALLWVWYVKDMKKREAAALEEPADD